MCIRDSPLPPRPRRLHPPPQHPSPMASRRPRHRAIHPRRLPRHRRRLRRHLGRRPPHPWRRRLPKTGNHLMPRYFPCHGKVFRPFSTLWKNNFHTVEKTAPRAPVAPKVFHTMENFFPHRGKISAAAPHSRKSFPHHGKLFSTLWNSRVPSSSRRRRANARSIAAGLPDERARLCERSGKKIGRRHPIHFSKGTP